MDVRAVGRGVLWFAIGAAVVGGAIFLLQQQISLQRESITIRSYTVAPDVAAELKSALGEALTSMSTDGKELGRVSLTADGRLLVRAPESVQRGVASIVAEVAATKPTPTPSIHFETWLVSAAPGTAANPDNAPGLTEVAPALADIQKAQGPLHFELFEKLDLRARAGDDSLIQGARSTMRVTATERNDTKGDPVIAARFNMEISPFNVGSPGMLKAIAELRPGQLLVIGQSNLPSRNFANPNPNPTQPTEQVYYIVRASL